MRLGRLPLKLACVIVDDSVAACNTEHNKGIRARRKKHVHWMAECDDVTSKRTAKRQACRTGKQCAKREGKRSKKQRKERKQHSQVAPEAWYCTISALLPICSERPSSQNSEPALRQDRNTMPNVDQPSA